MSVLQTVVIALACYSAVPMPFVAWDERNMRHMLAAFPLVGVLVGGCELLWDLVCGALGFGPVLRGAGFALIPLAVTGGIHMDGFADVVDAQSSHAEPERKRAILKDPHIGAFAAMWIAAYVVAYAALASELAATQVPLFACVSLLSRCLAGIACLSWPLASDQGMLATVRGMASVRATRLLLAIELVAGAALAFVVGQWAAVAALCAGGVAFAGAERLARRSFGGMSGDIAGWMVQVVELVMLAAIVVAGRVL